MKLNNLGFIESKLLKSKNILHGFGSSKCSLDQFKECIGTDICITETKQVHGNRVVVLHNRVAPVIEADAFISQIPGMACFIKTADCLPILLFDSEKKIVAAIHSGWRSLAAHIIEKTIYEMIRLGSNASDIKVALGPRIRNNCYEVGSETIESFIMQGWDHGQFKRQSNGKQFLSLGVLAQHSLISSGIKTDNIEDAEICTYCNEKYYSYRRNPNEVNRQISYIALR